MIDRFFVYVHRKADSGEVFYVGKGTVKHGSYERAHVTKKRSLFWQAIAAKHGVRVEIVAEFDSEDLAFQLERDLISHYGRRADGGPLCNMTLGGEGHAGLSASEATRKKLHDRFAGDGHPNWGKTLSEETRRKKSDSMKASPRNLKGKKLPDWWKQKIAATKVGDMNPMHGKTGLSHPMSRAVINAGYGYVFASVQDAADFFGLNMKTLYNQLSGHRPNKFDLEFA